MSVAGTSRPSNVTLSTGSPVGNSFPVVRPGRIEESHANRQPGERHARNHLGAGVLKLAVRGGNLLQDELIGVGVQRPDGCALLARGNPASLNGVRGDDG